MRRIHRATAPALALVVLVLAGCGSNSNNSSKNAVASASAPPAGAATQTATSSATGQTGAPATAAAGGTPAAAASAQATRPPAAPSQVVPASTDAAGQIEQKLVAALIGGSDLPAGLTVQGARQPLNNHQIAQFESNPSDAARFEQSQTAAGRITGALLNYAAADTNNPPDGISSLLIMLADYMSPAQASAALPSLLQLVKPAQANSQAYTVTRQDVTLQQIADETKAQMITIAPALGGGVTSTVWLVAVRRGAVDELYVETGLSGAPTQAQVLDIVNKQDAKVAKAGL